MLFAFYKGKKRFFNRFVARWSNGSYSHVEGVFGNPRYPVQCGSSSFMDGGVRLKVIALEPAHWDILDVPAIDADRMLSGFHELLSRPPEERRYDVPGLLSTSFPFMPHWSFGRFCNEVLGDLAGLRDAWRQNPSGFATVLEFLPGSRWVQWEEILAESNRNLPPSDQSTAADLAASI